MQPLNFKDYRFARTSREAYGYLEPAREIRFRDPDRFVFYFCVCLALLLFGFAWL